MSIKEGTGRRAVVHIGYKDYIMPIEDAALLTSILDRAERYERKYRSGKDSTYHVWQDSADTMTVELVPHELYLTAKLAGEPTE